MTRSGGSVSANAVKPRRSANSTVRLAPHAAQPQVVAASSQSTSLDDRLGHEARERVAHPLALERAEHQGDAERAERRP